MSRSPESNDLNEILKEYGQKDKEAAVKILQLFPPGLTVEQVLRKLREQAGSPTEPVNQTGERPEVSQEQISRIIMENFDEIDVRTMRNIAKIQSEFQRLLPGVEIEPYPVTGTSALMFKLPKELALVRPFTNSIPVRFDHEFTISGASNYPVEQVYSLAKVDLKKLQEFKQTRKYNGFVLEKGLLKTIR